MVVGGPTTVLDVAGLRIVSDPTFDAPGPHGYLTKTIGPVVADDQLGTVDLVLVSHDNHPDNLDDQGRALALAAPLVLTTRSGARRLGQPAIGLAPWTSHTVRRPDDRAASPHRPRNLDSAHLIGNWIIRQSFM
jgi:L-ascorbate metabolism protein UlaG (beta-lactamase superfamily)